MLGTAHELYRCAGCGLVHRGASWQASDSIAHYDGYYAGREVVFDPLTEARYHEVLTEFERHVAPGRLLDVGCGLGHFLAVAEARRWRPAGLEVSASGVRLLEQVRQERHLAFDIVQAHLLDANLPAGGFRAVTLFEVLEHLSDPRAHLERIRNLLEPGGVLYLTTPNFDSVSRRALGPRWRAMTPDHLCLFNRRAMRACLRATGFDVVTVRTKNIDVPEILLKWRQSPANGREVSTFGATQSLRQTLERRPWLGAVKSAVNIGLDWAGAGDTIEVLALKRTAA